MFEFSLANTEILLAASYKKRLAYRCGVGLCYVCNGKLYSSIVDVTGCTMNTVAVSEVWTLNESDATVSLFAFYFL